MQQIDASMCTCASIISNCCEAKTMYDPDHDRYPCTVRLGSPRHGQADNNTQEACSPETTNNILIGSTQPILCTWVTTHNPYSYIPSVLQVKGKCVRSHVQRRHLCGREEGPAWPIPKLPLQLLVGNWCPRFPRPAAVLLTFVSSHRAAGTQSYPISLSV